MSDTQKLLNQLTSGDLEKRIEAGFALSKLGDAVVDPLVALLKNAENSYLWWLVADTLGDIGNKRAVEPLIELLRDPMSFNAILARKYTAWALGKLKDARAVEVLIELLHDRIHEEEEDGYIIDEPDGETIEAAIWALTEIGDPRAIHPIIQTVLEGRYVEGSLLSTWGEPALKLLLEALNNIDDNIRGDAASLLGEFGDLKAVEPLIDKLQNDSSDAVRHHAAYALGELRDPRAYDALLVALNDKYEQTQRSAAMALGYLKDKRAIEPLKKVIQDDYPHVQHAAKWALNWLELP